MNAGRGISHSPRRQQMKHKSGIILLFSVLIAFGLCGCKEVPENSEINTLEITASEETKPEVRIVDFTDRFMPEAVSEEPSEESSDLAIENDSSKDSSYEQAPPADNTARAQAIADNMAVLNSMQYTDEQMAEINAFYSNTVFVGDSVLLGFRNYAAKSEDPLIHQMNFLAAGSLSLHNSFWPVSDQSVHPLYQGQQYPVWESIQMMGANRVFLFYGINDVGIGMQEALDLYPQLIAKIREYSPDADITIISATYTLKDCGKGGLNNDNLAAFNASVRDMAAQNNVGYIDMANILSDGAGNLAPEYCSDGFLHETMSAYDVWRLMLIRYAADRLGFNDTPLQNMMISSGAAASDGTGDNTEGTAEPADNGNNAQDSNSAENTI